MKIIVSRSYGGFGFSPAATALFESRGGVWPEDDDRGTSLRTNPTMIAIVEELGAEASGSFASLQIEEMPAGTRYIVDEYDGYESIVYRDNVNWLVAA